MKKSVLKSLFIVTLGVLSFSSVYAEERVVATVDGIPVLESQVRAAMGKKGNHQAALNKVIDDILVQKAIKESGVKINPREIDFIVEDIAAKNGLTYGQFLDALDYQGISLNAFRQQIANQMMMSGVRSHAINTSVQVTREEIDALGQKMLNEARANGTEQKVTGKEYEVRHILLKLNPLLNDAQAKAELNQIRADIISGKTTFADAALKYSKDYLSGANGGSLGYAFPETYVGAFAKAVQTTKQGSISAPFKSEFGWHILEVTGTRDGDRTEDAYRQKAYEKIVNSQLQDATKDWVKALRKTADIQYFNQ
ncbi:peptidylprolyl isomerase [Rodentibacter pneumotropicus]|uniref:Peptidylprolyl isomerase n=2 Tax=Rodentibacter pneumotropicus TaxID=758 RepID=A0A4S2QFW0_9PAST|nr:peptidylprolyl isomerase [Rodentibacter pneumotropicus]NBH76083.1 peptidylprolyl isomerase [Rodentibacter pneumotropicus]OOF62856.1 peptidylprolyl isomerase [Rodentibacter pneumotropicus]OOF64457.1 peptidylprolyl isomerase [Rodentibacter pneumotropicus]TGZ99434.1 peptidylprolyl isomerase [Rodentibacter pneumotropicus]THA01797.1 peptidylprolyl isomerase [Rodentibacter pneumotropicus]